MELLMILLIILTASMFGTIMSALVGSSQMLVIAILTGSASIVGMLILWVVTAIERWAV